MKKTINIKCIACECDITLPTEDKQCAQCGTSILKSQKVASKIFDDCAKQIKALGDESAKKALVLQNNAQERATDVTNKAEAKLKDLVVQDAAISEIIKVNEAAKEEITTIFQSATEQVEALRDSTNAEIAVVAKKAGYNPAKTTHSPNVEKSQLKHSLKEGLPYFYFKIFTNLMCLFVVGMGIGVAFVDTTPFLGLVVIIGGLLVMPFTHYIVSKRFTWLNYANMSLMGCALLIGGTIKFGMMIQ